MTVRKSPTALDEKSFSVLRLRINIYASIYVNAQASSMWAVNVSHRLLIAEAVWC